MISQFEEHIFSQAIELESPIERTRYIESACGDDHQLKRRVLALLVRHSELGGMLDTPPPELDCSMNLASRQPVVGDDIGPYRLQELLGEGGFGEVYLAEQTSPVTRSVALKIIKLGMDTRRLVRRFEAERQTLAQMSHPNIAEFYDAGTTETGRPFFVMELVRGVAITAYCDVRRLDLSDRLRLFLDVCRAVQHAHRKGVIHRDIKPTNVMVMERDGKSVPKIIDFGIAKATQHRSPQQAIYTEHRQFIGTPQYMSPEQLQLGNRDIDTRSDVFSLGVILYELLVGATPFDLQGSSDGDWERIRTTCAQESPSLLKRFGTLPNQDEIATNRNTSPQHLRKQIAGDLGWVVRKAISPDRDERYESAIALVSDVECYLSDLPVRARKQRIPYLASKFAKRHRGLLSMVGLFILIGIVTATYGYRSAQQRQLEADRNLYVKFILAADNAVQRGQGAQACGLLDSCREELRGWEWDRLRWLADRRSAPGITLFGLVDFSLSGDGKTIAVVSRSELMLYDVERQEVIWKVPQQTGARNSTAVAYSAATELILTADMDGMISFWDAATGSQIREPLIAHSQADDFRGLEFFPDNRHFVTGDAAGNLKVWDSSAAETPLWTRKAHTGIHAMIRAIAVSPDGKAIASCSMDGTVSIWNAKDGSRMTTLVDRHALSTNGDVAHKGYVTGVAFGPNSQRLVSCGHDRVIKVWDPRSGELIRTLTGHRSNVQGVAFSPDGLRIASVGSDQTLRIWDAETFVEIETLLGSASPLRAVAFTPSGQTMISLSNSGLMVWDTAPAPVNRRITGHESWFRRSPNEPSVLSMDISQDGHRIVTGHKLGLIKLWDADTGEELGNWLSPNVSMIAISVAISPDGKWIASGGSDGTLSVWNVNQERPLREFSAHGSSPVRALAISPNGQWMVSASDDKTIKIWDVETGTLQRTLVGHEQGVNCVVVSVDGKRIVSGSGDCTVRVWDVSTGTQIRKCEGHDAAVLSVTINQDGSQLVSGGQDRRVILWDARKGDALQARQCGDVVRSVHFSYDQSRIVSGTNDGTILLWSGFSTEPLWSFQPGSTGGRIRIGVVRFLPNDRAIVSGCSDGTLHFCDRRVDLHDFHKWNDVARARELVDRLTLEHVFYEDVLEALRDPAALTSDEANRVPLALRIVQARRMSYAKSLRIDALTMYMRDPKEEAFQEMRSLASRALRLVPDYPEFIWLMGLSQFAAGQYEQAAESFSQSDLLWQRVMPNGHPLPIAYLAMSLHKMGNVTEAEYQLNRLLRVVDDDPTWQTTHFRTLGIETAKALIGGQQVQHPTK